MNKRGFGFHVLMAVFSFFLIFYAYAVLVINPIIGNYYVMGEGLNDLLVDETNYVVIENYIDYSFKHVIFLSLDEFAGKNDVWSSNPDIIENDLKELIELRLNGEIAKIKQKFSSYENIIIPNEFEVEIVKNEDDFDVKVTSVGEFLVKTGENKLKYREDYPFVVLYDNLKFNYKVDFNLNIFKELYDKYSKLENDEECEKVQGNVLFGENIVGCSPDAKFLNFEVETKDLGLVKPVIKFKIAKPGKLFR